MKNKIKTATRETEKRSCISVSLVLLRYELTCLQRYQNRLEQEREFPVYINGCFPSARTRFDPVV